MSSERSQEPDQAIDRNLQPCGVDAVGEPKRIESDVAGQRLQVRVCWLFQERDGLARRSSHRDLPIVQSSGCEGSMPWLEDRRELAFAFFDARTCITGPRRARFPSIPITSVQKRQDQFADKYTRHYGLLPPMGEIVGEKANAAAQAASRIVSRNIRWMVSGSSADSFL